MEIEKKVSGTKASGEPHTVFREAYGTGVSLHRSRAPYPKEQ